MNRLCQYRFTSRILGNKTLFRGAASMITEFEKVVHSFPHREAVRYTDKNVKWTAEEFNKFVDMHANALIDYNFAVGTPVAIWMPECKEKHVFLMAAAKIGLNVIDVDTKINTVPQVREFLSISNCRMIVFDSEPKDGDSDRLLLLRKAIPEFYEYDDTQGQWFHSKYYPNLKYFLHTGFDIQLGCLNFKHWMINAPKDNRLEVRKQSLLDSTPLYRQILFGHEGLNISPIYTSEQVKKQKLWGFYDKLLSNEYFEL